MSASPVTSLTQLCGEYLAPPTRSMANLRCYTHLRVQSVPTGRPIAPQIVVLKPGFGLQKVDFRRIIGDCIFTLFQGGFPSQNPTAKPSGQNSALPRGAASSLPVLYSTRTRTVMQKSVYAMSSMGWQRPVDENFEISDLKRRRFETLECHQGKIHHRVAHFHPGIYNSSCRIIQIPSYTGYGYPWALNIIHLPRSASHHSSCMVS